MITRVDAVLALSNSGETPSWCCCCAPQAPRVPLIVMTGRTDSTLARARAWRSMWAAEKPAR